MRDEGEGQVGPELVRRLRADLNPTRDAPDAGERRTIGDLARLAKERAARHGERARRGAAPEDDDADF